MPPELPLQTRDDARVNPSELTTELDHHCRLAPGAEVWIDRGGGLPSQNQMTAHSVSKTVARSLSTLPEVGR